MHEVWSHNHAEVSHQSAEVEKGSSLTMHTGNTFEQLMAQVDYKTIPLTQGKVALVSPEDYDFISQWKWYAVDNKNTWYAVRASNNRHLAMHRAILDAPRGVTVDHRNHNGLDNRRCNIRLATHLQNCWNRRVQSATGYLGVSRLPRHKSKPFRAEIKINGQGKYLGMFASAEEAARTRDAHSWLHFGEFAFLNFRWEFTV